MNQPTLSHIASTIKGKKKKTKCILWRRVRYILFCLIATLYKYQAYVNNVGSLYGASMFKDILRCEREVLTFLTKSVFIVK